MLIDIKDEKRTKNSETKLIEWEKSKLFNPKTFGGPQRTILGLFLFLILINKAGFLQNNTGILATSCHKRRVPKKELHVNFVDDMTVIEVLDLKTALSSGRKSQLNQAFTIQGKNWPNS